jgi:N-acetylmuramoyl-L-alanine amidase
MPGYNELADRHYEYTSGEKNTTLDEWYALISEFKNIIRDDTQSALADDAQYAIASSWVWCIKLGDAEAPQHAIAAFRRLIYTYPDSEHLPQAHYWIAQCYTMIGDSARAAHHYQIVTNQYANTDVAADAQLALGRAYAQQGYDRRAETVYVDIVESATKKEIVTTASEELKGLKTQQNRTTPSDETPSQPKVQPDPETLTPGSLTREFGLTAKTIVIDAGHGGKDPGGGSNGNLIEKPIALSISKKIGAILTAKGYTVLLTRDSDRFIPLKERTAFATKHKADLFLSIHANASGDSRANGIETYYLDVTSTDKNAEIIAARENANSGYSIQELESLLKGLIVESKSKDSRRLAKHVQQELVAATGAADRGVKHARFVVLIGTSVPAILVETGFVTNPTEGKKLTSDAYQQKLATAIVRGVEKFLGNSEQISQDNSDQLNKFLAITER